MPRDIPLGNGNFLVAFDKKYQIRDLYWPYVGQENHSLGHPFRMGIWVDHEFKWIDDEDWERDLRYEHGTLVSAVRLAHPELDLVLTVSDTVDFHENLLLRHFDIENGADHEREVRIFFHHDFHVGGNEVGDTAYYEPDRKAVLHYKGPNWFLINGAVMSKEEDPPSVRKDAFEGIRLGVHQWSCGLKEIRNLQGTWRDAEDGVLSGETVAHGSVDSTVGFSLTIGAGQSEVLYYWMAAGETFQQVTLINRLVRQRGPEHFIQRTRAYWRLWLERHLPDYIDLPEELCRTYETSMLIMRTQIDNRGAILAANDTDISTLVRDTYSYMWPRDGALVANSLIKAGYIDLSRAFFQFCDRVLTKEGYLLHKYNPDGTLASSWHPWVREGAKSIPIQEDETALVLWALWEHFERFGDLEFIKPLYRRMITPIADFLADYRSPETGLPLPSYDLWEERYGILSWTVAATWAGLVAGANFTRAFGEDHLAEGYLQAAQEIKEAIDTYLWRPNMNCFARRLNFDEQGTAEYDQVIDASVAGLWLFGVYPADDPKTVAMMKTIEERLWVKTEVGGIARYEDDAYHQVSRDVEDVPGNPWFITTLWLAQWYAQIAEKVEDLRKTSELIEWASEKSLPSGVLAEQVHPHSKAPLSVSPLTWSHATYVATAMSYLAAKRRLSTSQGGER